MVSFKILLIMQEASAEEINKLKGNNNNHLGENLPNLGEDSPNSSLLRETSLSSSQSNLGTFLQEGLNLTDRQFQELQKLIQEKQFSKKDLTNPQKLETLISLLETLPDLNDEQREKILELKRLRDEISSPSFSSEEARQRLIEGIRQRRTDIQQDPNLSEEERQKALTDLEELERTLTEQGEEQGNEELVFENEERRRGIVLEKIIKSLPYLGIGLAILFLILLTTWREGK